MKLSLKAFRNVNSPKLWTALNYMVQILPEKIRPDFIDNTDPFGHRKHFKYAFLFFAFFPIIMLLVGQGAIPAFFITLMLSQGLIFGKELYDMLKPGGSGWSWPDIVAGEMGLSAPFVIYLYVFFSLIGA